MKAKQSKKSTKKVTKVRLKGSRFTIKRDRDGAGDTGALYPLDPKTGAYVKGAMWGDIRVGYPVFCGAWRTTMFGADTYWITTPVAEILEVSKDKTRAKFKTVNNSVYEATAF